MNIVLNGSLSFNEPPGVTESRQVKKYKVAMAPNNTSPTPKTFHAQATPCQPAFNAANIRALLLCGSRLRASICTFRTLARLCLVRLAFDMIILVVRKWYVDELLFP